MRRFSIGTPTNSSTRSFRSCRVGSRGLRAQCAERRGAARLVGALSICWSYLSCWSETTETPAAAPVARTSAPWVLANTNGTSVSSSDFLGRTTIIVFVTTHDAAAQIAVNKLESCLHALTRRANAAAIAMEPPDHVLLVQTFHDALHLTYPVLMPDPATLAGEGPFGHVEAVPTWIVFNSSGSEIWRGVGVNSFPRLREALVGLGNLAGQRGHGCE